MPIKDITTDTKAAQVGRASSAGLSICLLASLASMQCIWLVCTLPSEHEELWPSFNCAYPRALLPPPPRAAGGPQHIPRAGHQPAGALGHARPARSGAGACACVLTGKKIVWERNECRHRGAAQSLQCGQKCTAAKLLALHQQRPPDSWANERTAASGCRLFACHAANSLLQEMASPIVSYVGGKDYARGTKFSCMATSGQAWALPSL